MKCLIVTGGDAPKIETLQRLSADCQLIIAADSGIDTALSASIVPSLVVGDFDSTRLAPDIMTSRGISLIRYPEDKDETDTEIAISLAHTKGADYIVLAGAGGGRLDHLLAVFAMFARDLHPDEWQTQDDSIFFIPSGTMRQFKTTDYATISIFPIGQRSSHMHSTDLKWSLDGLVWERGFFGVSNRCMGNEFSVTAGTCPLLVLSPSGTESL